MSEETNKIEARIREYERAGKFDCPVEDDPPAPVLEPDAVDYLHKKTSTRVKTKIANFVGDRYFLKLIKKGALIIDGVEGEEHLSALQKGAVITCNHFSVCDHYIVYHCIRRYLPHKYLYKVVREGNYTNFPGLFGFFMRYCNTLPLSSNKRTMMNMLSACDTLLKRGESILVYPEQAMWRNYRKPRPYKSGAFRMAYKSAVPVLPMFISMSDDVKKDENGKPLQRHVLHVLPPVYPDLSLGEKLGAEKMRLAAFESVKDAYEKAYGIPLEYEKEGD